MFLGLVPLLWCEINPCGVFGRIRGEMASVMTTHLPSSLVAHPGGKLCEHLTGTQTRYPASTCSGGPKPKPTFDPQGLSHHVESPDHPARAFGSKFRAITRAITHGPSGVITVSRGRSRERTPVAQKHKHAGHRPMTCCFSGGQGRGRTADLPIFSRSSRSQHSSSRT
jgi:hypothetical protein